MLELGLESCKSCGARTPGVKSRRITFGDSLELWPAELVEGLTLSAGAAQSLLVGLAVDGHKIVGNFAQEANRYCPTSYRSARSPLSAQASVHDELGLLRGVARGQNVELDAGLSQAVGQRTIGPNQPTTLNRGLWLTATNRAGVGALS